MSRRRRWLGLAGDPPVAVIAEGDLAPHSFSVEAEIVGGYRATPPSFAEHAFELDVVTFPGRRDWRAVLVDRDGLVVARMPRARIGELVEVLNDLFTTDVTIPVRSRAGELVDAAEVLPAIECQIWRGDVLFLWGPVVEAPPEGDHFRLVVKDHRWHLTRRHVGELGGSFGGKPPYFHTPMVNERFDRGDTSGWSIFRTITENGFVGFGVVDPNAIRVIGSKRLSDGSPMVRCDAPLDPLDNLQLYQDLRIRRPQDDRALTVTLSGWWEIPTGGGYAPNNQRMGLLIATLVENPNLPVDYYRPTDWSFSELDEFVPRDRLHYQECELTLPSEGPEWIDVHVSVCFPQGTSYIGGLDLRVNDGLLYDESPSTIGPGLVMHAQDPAFGKSDANIGWTANTIGDRLYRTYVFNDHAEIWSSISSLAAEGWFDWWPSWSTTERFANFRAPKMGGHRRGHRIRLDRNGRGNVERIERQGLWQSAANVVAVQTRTNGEHERAARASSVEVSLEEISVAPKEPADYDLGRIAVERLAVSERAAALEVTSRPGDERFLLGLAVGDTTDVLSTVPGHRAAGRFRVVRRTIDTVRDAVVATLNPEAPT